MFKGFLALSIKIIYLFDCQSIHGQIDAAIKVRRIVESIDYPDLEEWNFLRSDEDVIMKDRSHFFHEQLLQVTVKCFSRHL
jgi:hypothetical protein